MNSKPYAHPSNLFHHHRTPESIPGFSASFFKNPDIGNKFHANTRSISSIKITADLCLILLSQKNMATKKIPLENPCCVNQGG